MTPPGPSDYLPGLTAGPSEPPEPPPGAPHAPPADVPAARLQLLNWRPRGEILETLAETTGVVFDTARVDSTDGVPELAERVSLERVVLGSHTPFLIPEAALIRVHESGRFSDAALRAVLAGNARQFQGVADA